MHILKGLHIALTVILWTASKSLIVIRYIQTIILFLLLSKTLLDQLFIQIGHHHLFHEQRFYLLAELLFDQLLDIHSTLLSVGVILIWCIEHIRIELLSLFLEIILSLHEIFGPFLHEVQGAFILILIAGLEWG